MSANPIVAQAVSEALHPKARIGDAVEQRARVLWCVYREYRKRGEPCAYTRDILKAFLQTRSMVRRVELALRRSPEVTA